MSSSSTSNEELLQQQMQTQQKINQLLEQSSEILQCGPNCQKQKTIDELKQQYLDAKWNADNAPVELQQRKKEYYQYAKGDAYYDQMQERELKKTAETIAQTLKTEFEKSVKNAQTLNAYLQTSLLNASNSTQLMSQYENTNDRLNQMVGDKTNAVLTNDRRTVYEVQELDKLKWWYSVMWYIYYGAIVILIVRRIFERNLRKVGLAIAFGLLPVFIGIQIGEIFFCGLFNKIEKKMSSFKQCIDALNTTEVKREIKMLLSPIAEWVWQELHPYVYISVLLVCLINMVLIINLVLLIVLIRK